MADNWLFVGVSSSRFFGSGPEFWQGESVGGDLLGDNVLPGRAVADVMGALISWAWIDIVTLTFKKIFGN